jgi:hypothetical protein
MSIWCLQGRQASSVDHLVGAGEQCRRDHKPQRFGGFNGVQERRCRLHENAASDYDDASCRQWELRSLDNFDAGFVAKFLTQAWNLRLRLRIHQIGLQRVSPWR